MLSNSLTYKGFSGVCWRWELWRFNVEKRTEKTNITFFEIQFNFSVFTNTFSSLLSTKNFDLAKCRLIDFIKGSKSMVFFAKYLIISSIVISNPLTSKIHIID